LNLSYKHAKGETLNKYSTGTAKIESVQPLAFMAYSLPLRVPVR